MATESHDHAAAIAVDPEAPDDNDSALGDDDLSATTSISSSVLDFRRENGRTYHAYKDGKYLISNDMAENDRLDLQHNLFLLTFDGRLGLAPPAKLDSKVGRVLDIGTGTGLWAIDFADEHPESQVLGFDLSPSQPSLVPPNVTFEISDLDDEWIYKTKFDYIHSRAMATSVSKWDELVQRSFEHLNPGGYLEFQEVDLWAKSNDGTFKEGSYLWRSTDYMEKAVKLAGRSFAPVTDLARLLTEAGFVDVVTEVFAWPTNPWPRDAKLKELGIWSQENALMNLSGIYMAPLTRVHGFTPAEVEIFLLELRKEMKRRDIHTYWPVYVVYGRKP
ncbi:S-adenosyl-L-methionine-dependent methyltransferase [Thozetella sp. PMI_491]|nr:S-adenosyl-L-methionine-dependent methyltransferase [Thozetella sp. PMI_491]